jgi:uncharacterized membrane-anchored protein
MSRLIDAYGVFRLYRKHKNSLSHSAKAAWRIAINRLPF